MTDLNKFTATGRITANAELKYTQSGTACTTFSIAVNKSYKKDDTWEERVHFFNCTIWGKYGESMQKHLVKGKQIAIEAELNHNPWTDKNEVRHNDVVLNIQNIVLLSSPKTKGQASDIQDTPQAASTGEYPDNIPF